MAGLICLCTCAAALAQGSGSCCAAKAVPAHQQILFGQDIAAFLEKDRILPPPHSAILFIGSSIFRCWNTLEQDMQPLPVVNRAFGGARTWEVLHYMDRIVLPYKPRIIVYYCGSNDMSFNATPDDIAWRFKLFAEQVHRELPQTLIFFVSIIKAPQKADQWNIIEMANTMIKDYCMATRGIAFIDLNPLMFDDLQKPRLGLYLDDRLHLKPAAYKEFTSIIRPLIERAWSSLTAE